MDRLLILHLEGTKGVGFDRRPFLLFALRMTTLNERFAAFRGDEDAAWNHSADYFGAAADRSLADLGI
jgi:hypothetical protein